MRREAMKNLAMIACFLVGACLLGLTLYVFALEVYFVNRAVRLEGIVVEVREDLVPQGKGSAVTYIPIVEISSNNDQVVKVPIETFSTYPIGSRLEVLCALSTPLKCKPNTFWAKWGKSTIDLSLSFIFISVPLFHYWRKKKEAFG